MRFHCEHNIVYYNFSNSKMFEVSFYEKYFLNYNIIIKIMGVEIVV